MKNLLLFILILIALPFIGSAQVSNPEQTLTFLPQTGFMATVDATDSTELATNDASAAIDGKASTFWETPWSSNNGMNLPHWIKINMSTSQLISGVYIIDRNNSGNSPDTVTVSTSSDGVTWTQQGGAFALPFDGSGGKIPINFPANVTCQFYQITITATQAWNVQNQVVNIAETGATLITIPDNTTYTRTNWVATASSEEPTGGEPAPSGPAAASIDNNTSSYWSSNWSATAPYPHYLIFDMGKAQPVNELSYVDRNNNNNSQAHKGNFSFSDDGTTWQTPVWDWHNNVADTFIRDLTSTIHKIILPSVQNHRYFRLEIDSNWYSRTHPLVVGTNDGTFYASTVAEIRAHYDAGLLPVTLTSFNAKVNGSAVDLTWVTASEVNSDHFDITRSSDVKNFIKIGSVISLGTSNTIKNYSFTDVSPLQGTNYYQLQQVDIDGKINKSNIVSVSLLNNNETNLKVETVTANAVGINVYTTSATKGNIIVSNISGEKIVAQALNLYEGNNRVQIPVNGAAGVYIVTISTNEKTISKQFIKP